MKRLFVTGMLFVSFYTARAENKYLNIYPQMRSIGTTAPLYLSAFTRGGKEVEIRLVTISRLDFEKYSVDPWSKSYQEILSKAKYNDSSASYTGKFNVKTGANYFQIKHGVKPGYYLIAAKLDGETVARSTLLVSDIGVIAKQSEAELLIQTVDLRSGKAWPKLEIRLTSGAGGKMLLLESDRDGLAVLRFKDHEIPRDQIRIVATNGHQEAQVFSGQTPYMDSKYQVFIDTDRPIYKGNDAIEWFAVIKKKKADGTFTAVTEGTAEYRISLPDGKAAGKGKVKINAWGKCSGNFRAPPETGGFVTIALTVAGENHQANVLVKDYVKPALLVEVIPDQNAVVFGSKIKGKIRSRFLYGAIPEGAEVQYEVYKGIYRKPEFEIRSEEKFFDIAGPARSGGKGDIVDQGKGVLDRDGEFEFLVKTSAEHKGSVFTIRATVIAKGSGGSEVDRGGGQAQVKVLAGSLVLSLRQDRFILQPGKEETLRMRVIDTQEKPAAKETIRVVVLEEKWKTNYKKNTTAEVEYLKVSEASGVSDAEGIASVPLSIPREGHFQVIATVKDSGGNEISESIFYWVAGSSFALSQPSLSELSVMADKRFYEPGETARILVSTAHKDAEILLTAEADRIYEHKLFRLKGNSLLYEIPLGRAHMPNLYISASLVTEGRLVTSVLPVFVSPQNRFIKVELENAARTYRPGDTVKMAVRTKGADGKGIAASVGLAVVDEAVYLVQDRLAPSIEKFFYGKRPNRTRLSYSFPQIFTGGAAKDSPEGEADRTKFRDTAFFSAHVETDANGKGSVEFILPGNLTTWRATGIASDKEDRVGQGAVKFIATKELISRLSVPRFLNTASSGKVTGIVQNLTEEPLEIEGYFRAKGLKLKGNEKFTGIAKPRQLLTFEIEVSSDTEVPDGKIAFFVASKDKRFKDSLEKPLPVHETGLDHLFASPGVILDSAKSGEITKELVIPFPKDLNDKNFRLKEFGLNIVPDLGAAITGSLTYLLEYPHGCVEQTTSRFLPNIEVLRFMKRHNLKSEKLAAMLEKHIRGGIQSLQALQNEKRGAWGWWQSNEDHAVNHWMTAYALYGLVEAQREGYDVDEKKLKKGLATLQKMILETGGEKSSSLDDHDYPQKESFVYFANYILTRAGRGDASVTDAGIALAETSRIESLGWALRSLHEEKRKGEFSKVRKILVGQAKNGVFSEKLDPTQVNTSDAHYAAIAVSGLAGAKIDPQFVTALLAKRDLAGKFISTRDTAASVYAILSFIDTNPDYLKTDYEMIIEYAPGKTEKISVQSGDTLAEPKKILLDPAAFAKGRKISVKLKGKGLAQVYAYVKGFERTEDFHPIDNGISVERHYVEAGKEAENSKFTGSLIVGDAIDVVVKIEMKNQSGNYLFVSESVPPGFTIESDFDYSYGRRNVIVTKERIYFYAENYSGTESFRYRIRAVNPGNYLVPPARAELMYNDSVNGSSGAEVIKVE
jgi:alpha-2-macroglobulin